MSPLPTRSWEKKPGLLDELMVDIDVAYIDGTFYDNKELPERIRRLVMDSFCRLGLVAAVLTRQQATLHDAEHDAQRGVHATASTSSIKLPSGSRMVNARIRTDGSNP